jgi:hypothetical protein
MPALLALCAKLKKLHIVPNLDGDGFVARGASARELSKEDFSSLIEAIHEFIATAQLELPPVRRMIEPARKLLALPRDEGERVF